MGRDQTVKEGEISGIEARSTKSPDNEGSRAEKERRPGAQASGTIENLKPRNLVAIQQSSPDVFHTLEFQSVKQIAHMFP